jgi:uncharacterized Zn finger protein
MSPTDMGALYWLCPSCGHRMKGYMEVVIDGHIHTPAGCTRCGLPVVRDVSPNDSQDQS